MARMTQQVAKAMAGLAARRAAAAQYRQSAQQYRDGHVYGPQDPDTQLIAQRHARESYNRQGRGW